MSRQQPPDRLAAILAELDEGRRTPWLPDEDELIDRRPVFGLRRRRRTPQEGGLAALGFDDLEDDRERDSIDDQHAGYDDPDDDPDVDVPWPEQEPHTRAERRSRGHTSPAPIRPHTPLFRTPLPDTDIETRPGRSALLGALVVLVVVAIIFGFRVWSARQQATPTPLAVPSTAAAKPGGSTAAAGSASPNASPNVSPNAATGLARGAQATATQPTGFVLVHVVGQVRRPGVVRLPAGSRVDDAIKAAGGATPAADLSAVNLARPLGDGEQVHVPKPGETPSVAPAPATTGGATTGGGGSGGSGGRDTAGPVNLNTASEADLDGLPGVGPVLAARILQWRTTNGRFSTVDDLGEVAGIGDKLLEQLRPLVTV
ncbi:ComEA family DNA-binding protein [Calidifontibacter indicus]|uniref:Competence protein ComEA n=1 Tax=Calidifontibacter indicus TaxID=419650 RepID=A0A3D9UY79_9MICO|nr:ComEA family DNA-binding protein [Calidifontibacter indicus]REF31545.1 competence protein ComEA [Calidifontibacter indicus]